VDTIANFIFPLPTSTSKELRSYTPLTRFPSHFGKSLHSEKFSHFGKTATQNQRHGGVPDNSPALPAPGKLSKPRSGERIQPTALAVGKVRSARQPRRGKRKVMTLTP
jgi:hypothetical protein